MRNFERRVVPKHADPRTTPLPPPVTPPNMDAFREDCPRVEHLLHQKMLIELRQLNTLVQHAQETMVMKFQDDLCATRDAILVALNSSTPVTPRHHVKEDVCLQLHGEEDEVTVTSEKRAEIKEDWVHTQHEQELEKEIESLQSEIKSLREAVEEEEIAKRRSASATGESQRLHSLLANSSEVSEKAGSPLEKFVRSARFEIISVVFILINTCMMALEVQVQGLKIGSRIGYNGYNTSMPWADTVFVIASLFFNIIFVIELCLRIFALKMAARYSAWIWLDFFLVAFGVFDLLTVMKLFGGFGFNPSMLRVIRLIRLMRLVKTLRAGKGAFHSLFLLVKSVQASFTALFWSVLLLFMMCLSTGMLIHQLTSSYLEDREADLENRKKVFAYFGTFTRTMVTMFEITLGNWGPPARLLTDHVSEMWGVLIVAYRNVFCFAVINVIRAVFIMETTRVASGDDEVALMNKFRNHANLQQKLAAVFSVLDADGDGALSWSEFMKAMRDERVVKYMSTLELEGDTQQLFHLLSSVKDGASEPTVSCSDFVHHVGILRGNARAIDMNLALLLLNEIKESLCHDHPTRQSSFHGMAFHKLSQRFT